MHNCELVSVLNTTVFLFDNNIIISCFVKVYIHCVEWYRRKGRNGWISEDYLFYGKWLHLLFILYLSNIWLVVLFNCPICKILCKSLTDYMPLIVPELQLTNYSPITQLCTTFDLVMYGDFLFMICCDPINDLYYHVSF